jgi:death on curing protein
LPALNGHELLAMDVDCVQIMLAVAAGELDETALAAWLRSNTRSMNKL